jgi:hypothetical protein
MSERGHSRPRQGGAALFIGERIAALSFNLKHRVYQCSLILLLLFACQQQGFCSVGAENLHEFPRGTQQSDPIGNPIVPERVDIDDRHLEERVECPVGNARDFFGGDGLLPPTLYVFVATGLNNDLADDWNSGAGRAVHGINADWEITIGLNNQKDRDAVGIGDLFPRVFNVDDEFRSFGSNSKLVWDADDKYRPLDRHERAFGYLSGFPGGVGRFRRDSLRALQISNLDNGADSQDNSGITSQNVKTAMPSGNR